MTLTEPALLSDDAPPIHVWRTANLGRRCANCQSIIANGQRLAALSLVAGWCHKPICARCLRILSYEVAE